MSATLGTAGGQRIANVEIPASPAPVRVVFDGQSLLRQPPDPNNCVNFAMDGIDVSWRNPGVGGASWTALLNSGTNVLPASQRTWPFLNADFTLVVCLGGTSDILFEANTGEQTFADLVTYADAARVAGADAVIAGTITPTTSFSPTMEGYRVVHNALLLADAGNDFDGTFDVTVPPLDDATNTAYYPDHLHWNAAGAQIAGDIMHAAIVAALP